MWTDKMTMDTITTFVTPLCVPCVVCCCIWIINDRIWIGRLLMGPSNAESAGILSFIIYPHCLSVRNWLVCDLLTLVRSNNNAISNSWLFIEPHGFCCLESWPKELRSNPLSPLEKHIQGLSWKCSMCILWRETLIRMFRTIAFINDQTHILLS